MHHQARHRSNAICGAPHTPFKPQVRRRREVTEAAGDKLRVEALRSSPAKDKRHRYGHKSAPDVGR